jgi:hypothetical protein
MLNWSFLFYHKFETNAIVMATYITNPSIWSFKVFSFFSLSLSLSPLLDESISIRFDWSHLWRRELETYRIDWLAPIISWWPARNGLDRAMDRLRLVSCFPSQPSPSPPQHKRSVSACFLLFFLFFSFPLSFSVQSSSFFTLSIERIKRCPAVCTRRSRFSFSRLSSSFL